MSENTGEQNVPGSGAGHYAITVKEGCQLQASSAIITPTHFTVKDWL
jgi:hypothetical protein